MNEENQETSEENSKKFPESKHDKIDLKEIKKLEKQGYTQRYIAAKMGISRASIGAIIRKAQSQNLDAIHEINTAIVNLDGQLEWIRQCLRRHKTEKPKEAHRNIVVVLQNQQLKHVAEVRHLMAVALEIAKVMHDKQEVEAFQKTVIEVLEEVDPTVKEQFIKRLRKRRSIRQVVGESKW